MPWVQIALSKFLLKSWQLATGAIPKGNRFGRKPIQLQKQSLAFIWYISNMEVIRSVVKQTKIGVWPGTGFEWQMVSAFTVQVFRLGILDYISRRSVYDFGKFPFGQTKTVLPFTSQPKFLNFSINGKQRTTLIEGHYHRFRWYATLENKTPVETFPKSPSVLRVIDRSDRSPPITATSVTF